MAFRVWGSVVVAMGMLLSSCNHKDPLFLKLEANQSGLQFENKLTPTKDFNIIDYIYFYNGGGVSIGDINEDGLPDIFFAGNQVKNKLYLNRGGLKFEDITATAGVEGNSSWNTGSLMGDVNGDGLLDIYVCSVVGLKNLSGHNELFINNGDNTFSEKSVEFGLDFESYSSSAAFLDYDLDGDLDMFLLNHAVHTPESFGHANLRNNRTYESGGKLLRNDGNKFVDVSESAKIYGGINGYGLGLSISDFNIDGYPDIYVGNDFHEDDYLYINNRDGTFTETGKQAFTLTSKFSMGNDVADINHDGLPDLISLDMLPEDESILKRSVDDENISILKMRTEKYGYNFQFPRNTLQINNGNGRFSETALMSGVAATDWSWSALFADWDMDGNQDLFIANGIPMRPNDLDYIKYVSSEQVSNTMETTNQMDDKVLSLMPSGMAQNYIFKGSGKLRFSNLTEQWLPKQISCSTSAAMADLDNDGDLDLVINNVNDLASIYINQVSPKANYIKINFNYTKSNFLGIGTKVYSYHRGILQYKELYTARGFQASSEPIVHFGYGDNQVIDSLKIVWPNGTIKKLYNLKMNQTLTISPIDSKIYAVSESSNNHLFQSMMPEEIGITYRHVEDNYTDFDRLKLLPYQQSDRGPAVALGDINNDGKTDIYFGGSKRIASRIFIQGEDQFNEQRIADIFNDSIKEDIDAVIEDFNADDKSDLFVVSGGADFYGASGQLLDTYYKTTKDGFEAIEIDNFYGNSSCVKSFDFDKDGDLDVFVGTESIPNDFGKKPQSYLLLNENGSFVPYQQEVFNELGMVTDAVWSDYNNDGFHDLIIVGEWMEPVFLKNNNGSFEKEKPYKENLDGLWQVVTPFDIDADGDQDYILGNWGLNSRFVASATYPMVMYYHDFDGNGIAETVITIAKGNNYYPLDGFDLLASQIPMLRKKYTNYKSFAGQRIEEVFSSNQLTKAIRYEVQVLASGYLKNDNGLFSFNQFDDELQIAPILAMISFDFDDNGSKELLVAGNYFGVQPFHGRFGSFEGALIDNGKIVNAQNTGLNLWNKSVRNLSVIKIRDTNYLMATVNNGPVQIYRINKGH